MYQERQKELGEEEGREVVGRERAVDARREGERLVRFRRLVLDRRVHERVHRAPPTGPLLELPHERTRRVEVVRIERQALDEAGRSGAALRLAPQLLRY